MKAYMKIINVLMYLYTETNNRNFEIIVNVGTKIFSFSITNLKHGTETYSGSLDLPLENIIAGIDYYLDNL